MVLDLPTLFAVTAFVTAFVGLLLLVIDGVRRDAVAIWAGALLTGAFGMLLAGLGGPGTFLAQFATVAMLFATGLGWVAACVFSHRRPSAVLVLLGPASWFVTASVPLAGPGTVLALACWTGAAYTAGAARALWAGRREHLAARGTAVTLLAIHAVLYAARGGAALLVAPPHSAIGDAVARLLLVEALLHTTGMAFALVAMARQRAESRTTNSLIAARDAADAAAQARLRFLSHMSHEFRTPLHGMLGMARLVADSPGTVAASRERLDTLTQAGEHLLAVVNDSLDLARMNAARIELQCAPVALAACLDECRALIAPSSAAKSIAVEIDVAPSVPRAVLADPTRLRQIVLNLLANAVRFTPMDGIIRLRARPAATPGGPLRLEVVDTGAGVLPHERSRLFQDYTQFGPAERREGGTGLGLSICAALVAAMGGRIGHEPGPGGIGSRFWVDLPLTEATEPSEAQTKCRAAQAHDHGCDQSPMRHVLVADDVPTNGRLARALLEPCGFTVTLVHDGAQAVEASRATPFCVILMDVRMPTMDGLQAARLIRDEPGASRDAPIVGMTADLESAQVALCVGAGMDAVLAKPFRRDELLAAIQPFVATGPIVETKPGEPATLLSLAAD